MTSWWTLRSFNSTSSPLQQWLIWQGDFDTKDNGKLLEREASDVIVIALPQTATPQASFSLERKRLVFVGIGWVGFDVQYFIRVKKADDHWKATNSQISSRTALLSYWVVDAELTSVNESVSMDSTSLFLQWRIIFCILYFPGEEYQHEHCQNKIDYE